MEKILDGLLRGERAAARPGALAHGWLYALAALLGMVVVASHPARLDADSAACQVQRCPALATVNFKIVIPETLRLHAAALALLGNLPNGARRGQSVLRGAPGAVSVNSRYDTTVTNEDGIITIASP